MTLKCEVNEVGELKRDKVCKYLKYPLVLRQTIKL